jgi:hypothetical protein
MKLTGTLIEDLMATVERAERRAQSEGVIPVEASVVEPMYGETCSVELWFATVPENTDYDPKFLGVA